MKKGSRIRRCHVCRTPVFWIIPDGDILGIPLAKQKKIKPFLYRENKLWCEECYKKR